MKRLGPFFDHNAQHLTVQSTHSQLVAMDDWGKGGACGRTTTLSCDLVDSYIPAAVE